MKKTNKKMMILSAIGIIMVVDSHSYDALKLMTNIFPYTSFYMALFVFISGYFFNEKKLSNIVSYNISKSKKLLIPYYFYNLIYFVFLLSLNTFTSFQIGEPTLKNLVLGPWIHGEYFGINNPSWFVPTLFLIILIYSILRKTLKNVWNDHFFSALFIILGLIVIYLSKIDYINEHFIQLVQISRVAYLMQFYHMGYIYKKYYEQRITNDFCVILSTIIINSILILIFGGITVSVHKVRFDFVLLSEPISLLSPFVVSCTGILFWVSVSSLLTSVLKDNQILNFISNHTFDIMMHHIFFMFLLNVLLLIVDKYGAINVPNLDVNRAMNTAWYRYPGDNNNFYIFYFFSGIVGSSLASYFIYLIKKHFYSLREEVLNEK